MGTNTVMVDMMILFLVILIGWQIFCREREKWNLSDSSDGKKRRRGIYQCEACGVFFDACNPFFFALCGTVFVRFFLVWDWNLDVALQSLSEYRNCVLPVSIGTYIWLFLEIKVAACLVFGSLIVFFMITWKRFVPAVCSYFWVMLIEYVLYTTVNSLSKWNWFRYVNLFSILDASQPFTVYWNLNLFSYPIWAECAKMVLCIATILLCNRAFDFDLLS